MKILYHEVLKECWRELLRTLVIWYSAQKTL